MLKGQNAIASLRTLIITRKEKRQSGVNLLKSIQHYFTNAIRLEKNTILACPKVTEATYQLTLKKFITSENSKGPTVEYHENCVAVKSVVYRFM